MVPVYDNNNHDKFAVIPFSFYVLNHIKDKFKTEVKNIEIWTDGPGPSSQFKNKFSFAYVEITWLLIFDFKFTWNYSAAIHDKGTVDRPSYRWFSFNANAIIKNSDSLFNAASHKTKIHLTVITEEYTRATLFNAQMQALVKDVHALTLALHIHCIKFNKKRYKNDEK